MSTKKATPRKMGLWSHSSRRLGKYVAGILSIHTMVRTKQTVFLKVFRYISRQTEDNFPGWQRHGRGKDVPIFITTLAKIDIVDASIPCKISLDSYLLWGPVDVSESIIFFSQCCRLVHRYFCAIAKRRNYLQDWLSMDACITHD